MDKQDLFLKSFCPEEFGFDAGLRAATLMDSAGGRMHMSMPVAKTAGEVDAFVAALKPDPGHSYVHLISLGALEWYGANKRGDGFNESGGEYRPPAPWSPDAAVVKLDGGLKAYHNSTFKANGKVYREHDSIVSNRAARPLGEVVLAIYNDAMHRGELVIRLDNDEWADDLGRIAEGKPAYFSMGCLCPNDVCSWCGKRVSPRRTEDRCEHLKRELLSFKGDGTQVVAITDTPIFYDISRVARPADKIAFSLAKVASEAGMAGVSPCPRGAMPASFLDKLHHRGRVDRLGLLVKIAAEEKGRGKEATLPVSLPDEEERAILKGVAEKDVPKAIFILNRSGALLPYPSFIRLLGGTGPAIDAAMPLVGGHLSNVFSGVLADQDCLGGFLEDGTYEGEENDDRELVERLLPLIARHSLDEGRVARRVAHVVIVPHAKMASDSIFTPRANELASKLAREYARYQLAFLTGNRADRSIRLALAQNNAEVLV